MSTQGLNTRFLIVSRVILGDCDGNDDVARLGPLDGLALGFVLGFMEGIEFGLMEGLVLGLGLVIDG